MTTKPTKHTPFSAFAHRTTGIIGSYRAFIYASLFIAAWLCAGPVMDFSSEWELIFVFVTGTVTLYMIILLQHSQNHVTKALHLKLDELIRAHKKARNTLVEVEQAPEQKLNELKDEFTVIREDAVRQEEIREEVAEDAEKVREAAF